MLLREIDRPKTYDLWPHWEASWIDSGTENSGTDGKHITNCYTWLRPEAALVPKICGGVQ